MYTHTHTRARHIHIYLVYFMKKSKYIKSILHYNFKNLQNYKIIYVNKFNI